MSLRDRIHRRLIPAHAGSTCSATYSLTRRGAHPRSRGEHLGFFTAAEDKDGSSPLTRGAPLGERDSLASRGLIPAHAGSTGLSATHV
ncbi:hypothetical protein HMPREF3227_01893 [Corynebacterium sp. CMW7794]|nr:hypothetical protein HMPREF3227_01893 [Corynebacterium sp. CMW7794]